ncbi:MAG: hypothetical protein DMD36_19350 [Gemmatimonadetes bacterium]|nr:MAG: hypothetical protein DMD36_19350 [Gemmatimonadota bacterium]
MSDRRPAEYIEFRPSKAFLDLWAAVVSGVIGFSLGTIFGERGVAGICWAIRRLPWWVAW